MAYGHTAMDTYGNQRGTNVKTYMIIFINIAQVFAENKNYMPKLGQCENLDFEVFWIFQKPKLEK